ncbi:MAG: hypothetical protein GY829_04215, partial [Gammaproteobacteria bacterium]|nr:hypothetical protein [Gammaproteobacteria bacterium]
ILLLFILITVLINTRQFRILGIEVTKVSSIEVPAITALHNLDLQIYQQAILRNEIVNTDGKSAEHNILAINRYHELSLKITENHETIVNLMKNYAKLEMPSTKRRWKRLQENHQTELQASFDMISVTYTAHKAIALQVFNAMAEGKVETVAKHLLQLHDLDETLHLEIDKLTRSAYNGIASSDKKIHNIEYGARQMTFFLLFWFYLIGIILGVFIKKMLDSRLQ